jgi:hypothetical protein
MRAASSPHLETTYDVLSGDEVAAASERSPSFDLAAIASVAGLRDSRGCVPLDFCVPTKTSVDAPPGLDLATLLVLAHVDGRSSLKDISAKTKLPLPKTIESFLQLLALGVVQS